jgi:hypothetical protein
MGQAAYGANETIGPHAQALVRPGQGPPKSGSIMRRAVIAKPSARSPLKLRHRDRLHSPRNESEREGGWQPRPNAQHWAGVCAWADETERASDTGMIAGNRYDFANHLDVHRTQSSATEAQPFRNR